MNASIPFIVPVDPMTDLQLAILREARNVTDLVREERFTYGDAPINPAIDHTARKVSCDRLVCWVMYDLGFTDQPRVQGVVVSRMIPWCEAQGFARIDSAADLQPGDIVLVNPDKNGVPGHTFLFAGRDGKNNGFFYRYDCGSDIRIHSVQPFYEQISNFICAYRPEKK